MARYIDAEIAIEKCDKLINGADTCPNPYAIEGIEVVRNLILSECKTGVTTADVVEIEKVAEILADVAGASPCDLIGNEWLVSCCEHAGYCCATSDSECWVQYFKHYKERSENNG